MITSPRSLLARPSPQVTSHPQISRRLRLGTVDSAEVGVRRTLVPTVGVTERLDDAPAFPRALGAVKASRISRCCCCSERRRLRSPASRADVIRARSAVRPGKSTSPSGLISSRVVMSSLIFTRRILNPFANECSRDLLDRLVHHQPEIGLAKGGEPWVVLATLIWLFAGGPQVADLLKLRSRYVRARAVGQDVVQDGPAIRAQLGWRRRTTLRFKDSSGDSTSVLGAMAARSRADMPSSARSSR